MHDVGNTPGWKWYGTCVYALRLSLTSSPRLFIIEGLATVVISCVAFFILPGKFLAMPSVAPIHPLFSRRRLPNYD